MKTDVKETINRVGEELTLAGWVSKRRAHGKIIFIDLRDFTGTIQAVFTPADKETYEKANRLRPEWVIKIKGKVNKRPENMINEELETGKVEIEAKDLEILSEAQTPPFSIEGEGYDIDEEKRLRHRFVDIRRERLQNNLRNRQKLIHFTRNYLIERGFLEVETPILTKSTPEGARDFLVPSRLHADKFYALPQAPQQYKQILQAAGVEKYFQIARCFRDEDPRGDRQSEFTQIDLEMSFAEENDIMGLTENLLISLTEELYPNKKISQKSFPKITYKEAMEKYGTDRPDLRKDKKSPNELAFLWIVDFPFFEKTDENKWTFTHNPFSAPKSEFIDALKNKRNIENILTTQYDIVLNGFEVGGGSIRAHDIDILKAVFDIMGYGKEEVEEKFGHFLEIFKYGLPPHGGIAPGLDRLLMLLQNEPNIREVMAFPKTGDGRSPMMKTPSKVSEKQLKELNIKINKNDEV